MPLPRIPVIAAAVLTAGAMLGAPPAGAVPSDFPDVGAYPPVDAAGYAVNGGTPSSSGWGFSTAAGIRCQDSFIAEVGVLCVDPASSPARSRRSGSTSVVDAGEVGPAGTDLSDGAYPVVPTGTSISTASGLVCAVPADDTLACLAAIPRSWGTDVPNPPGKVYGEHGFVLGPSGGSTTF